MMKKMKNNNINKTGLIMGAFCLIMVSCKAPSLTPTEKIELPEFYMDRETDSTTISSLSWKTFFPDTLLQSYIAEALNNNHTFLQTIERISVARSQVRVGKGALLPDLSLGIDGGVQRFGEYTMDGVGNSTTNIWGKLTDKKRSAVSRWMQSVEAMRLARTLLISEVGTHYFELIGLDKQRYVLREAILTARDAYNLTNELMKEGEVTRLSVDQFRSRRLKLEEMLLANEQQISEKERAIATLLGRLPFKVKRVSFETACSYEFPTDAGIPSQLLQYRPDIKAAELELLASKSDVSAARKAFFPSIVIGGNGGFNAFDLDKWFTAPASLVYNLGAGITAPIFKQNTIRALWNDAKSQQRIALLGYHETVLKAYEEVLNLITASSQMHQRKELKEEESRIHHRSIYNANEMFKVGFAGYLDVLSADERFLDCELERIALNVESCKLHIMLYRALGGGSN